MTTTDLATYEGQVGRFNTGYIVRAGKAIRRALDGHRPPLRYAGRPEAWTFGLAYAPDNGSAYGLVFAPVQVIDQLAVGDSNDRAVPVGSFGGVLPGRVEVPYSGHTLVAKCDGVPSDFAAVFDLSDGQLHFHWDVAERTGMGFADACALTALFRAACG